MSKPDNTQELDEILRQYPRLPHEQDEIRHALLDWHQQEIAKARINEAQVLYEDAINSTSHGHITYARKRVERHLETLKQLEAEL